MIDPAARATGVAHPDITPFTQPTMPPLAALQPYLEAMWSRRRLTDCGPFHEQLEQALETWLGVENLALTANGTIGLLLALQAFDLDGEVITTPFSFVSTVHAIRWSRLRPVFVDIDPLTGNLDPAAIEAAITPRTRAIMPVHCFGHPCDVDAIAQVADLYGLKLIYDAAHAFGVERGGQSLLRQGDASVLSFHASMVFHCFEGGAVVCADERTKRRIERLRNFGLAGRSTVVAPGINGHMNEFQAAVGLAQLAHVDQALAARARLAARYRAGLGDVPGIRIFAEQAGCRANHAYFPIVVEQDHVADRDECHERLRAEGINARRCFYPLTAESAVYRDLPSARAGLPQARMLARQILCLPLYPDLPDATVDQAISVLAG